MENIDTSAPYYKNPLLVIKILFLLIFSMSLVLSIFLYFQNRGLRAQLSRSETQLASLDKENPVEYDEVEQAEALRLYEINRFIEYSYSHFPLLADLPTDSIVNIYPFPLKQFEQQSAGWLVETDENGVQGFYLVSKLVEKKLVDVMVANVGVSVKCTVSHVVTVGNDRVFDLVDENGYLIIAGENCTSYGGGNSVSVFSLSTGEKIPLTGNFDVRGSIWKGTTELGTATGSLLGVFGVKRPKVVVTHGRSSSNKPVGEMFQIATFDLQTGKLDSIENIE